AFYGGEARGSFDPNGSTGEPSPMEAFLTAAGLGGQVVERGSARMRDIRSAALLPLLAVAPSAAQLDDEADIASAIGTGPARAATGARIYNHAALAVTFPEASRGDAFRDRITEPEGPLTVRVTYLFHCGIPLVPILMCDQPGDLADDLAGPEAAQVDIGFLAGLSNPRVLILRGETTLRNQ